MEALRLQPSSLQKLVWFIPNFAVYILSSLLLITALSGCSALQVPQPWFRYSANFFLAGCERSLAGQVPLAGQVL